MRFEIPDELAKELFETAQATGSEPDIVAVASMRQGLNAREQLEKLLLPVRVVFKASGLSEDEAIVLFEAEQHALRQGGREEITMAMPLEEYAAKYQDSPRPIRAEYAGQWIAWGAKGNEIVSHGSEIS